MSSMVSGLNNLQQSHKKSYGILIVIIVKYLNFIKSSTDMESIKFEFKFSLDYYYIDDINGPYINENQRQNRRDI